MVMKVWGWNDLWDASASLLGEGFSELILLSARVEDFSDSAM
jgi:hypothetical protein